VDILAAFFDPSDNGFDIVDTAQIVGLVVLISGVVAGIFRANAKRAAAERQAERDAVKRELLAAIDERTKPIQPGYRNGGESLADISGIGRMLMDRQLDVIRDVRGIRERLDHHIDWHQDKEG
jgi:hypothetical protein